MLKVGKLDSDVLERIVFDKLKYRREEVITRPGIGEDCAVVDYGDHECVLSTDPITASIEDIGHLAVHISCNDIASNGIEPVGLLLAVLLPEGTTETDIERMMEQVGKASEELGVETKESDYKFICEYIDDHSWEIAQVYLLKLNLEINNFKLQEEEVSEVKWLSYDEFKKLFYSDDFVKFNNDYRELVLNMLKDEFDK